MHTLIRHLILALAAAAGLAAPTSTFVEGTPWYIVAGWVLIAVALVVWQRLTDDKIGPLDLAMRRRWPRAYARLQTIKPDGPSHHVVEGLRRAAAELEIEAGTPRFPDARAPRTRANLPAAALLVALTLALLSGCGGGQLPGNNRDKCDQSAQIAGSLTGVASVLCRLAGPLISQKACATAANAAEIGLAAHRATCALIDG